MIFEPREYVAVADLLCRAADEGTCPPDAARRAAIGRYYYAALLTAREMLERESPMRGDRAATTHGSVISTLRESADTASQRLMLELNSMRQIRNRPELADLALIAVTAKAMKGDRQKCLDAGASDYIAKPVDIELLLALLRVWVARAREANGPVPLEAAE